MLQAARRGLMLSVRDVCDFSFHSSAGKAWNELLYLQLWGLAPRVCQRASQASVSPAVLGCHPAFAMDFHSFGVLQTADLMTEH